MTREKYDLAEVVDNASSNWISQNVDCRAEPGKRENRNLRNLVSGRYNKSVVKLKACILQTRVVDSKERKRESSIEVIKMIRNCWVRKCWQPIKEPVNREDYGDRFTWKPNLTEVYSIHFDDTSRLLIFSNIQSFDLVLDQLTVSRTITIVTSPAYNTQLFIRDLEFSYFFAFQSVCIWNC